MRFKISMFDFDVSLTGTASGKRQRRGEVSGAATAEASVVIYDGNKPITLSRRLLHEIHAIFGKFANIPKAPKTKRNTFSFCETLYRAVSGAVPRTKSFYCSDFNPPL